MYRARRLEVITVSLDSEEERGSALAFRQEPFGAVVYRPHRPVDPLTLRRNIVDRLGRSYF